MLAEAVESPVAVIVLVALLALPVLGAVSLLLLRYRFRVVDVWGLSMYPYLKEGDRVVVERRPGRFDRGDVVVILSPDSPGQLVKRIAAVGGDRLPGGAGAVPPGHVFVLGDNLASSRDSRHFGFVPIDRLVGRVIRRLT